MRSRVSAARSRRTGLSYGRRRRRWARRHDDDDGQRLVAAHRRRRGDLGAVEVDVPLGEALQHLVERDPAFEARERGAEAEVDAVPEREVLADLAVDVEAVGVVEAALVAVRRRRRGTASRCPRERSGRTARRPRGRSGRSAGRAARSAAAPRSRWGSATRSSTSSRRWSGCSASTLPAQPIRRVVVSLPAPATTVV